MVRSHTEPNPPKRIRAMADADSPYSIGAHGKVAHRSRIPKRIRNGLCRADSSWSCRLRRFCFVIQYLDTFLDLVLIPFRTSGKVCACVGNLTVCLLTTRSVVSRYTCTTPLAVT